MSKALDKHKARQQVYLLPTADTTLALLLRRCESGESLIVKQSPEARAMIRKAAHEERKRKA